MEEVEQKLDRESGKKKGEIEKQKEKTPHVNCYMPLSRYKNFVRRRNTATLKPTLQILLTTTQQLHSVS